ncbi:MAG: undecaprenyl-diphosphate phosphatase [Pseudomonadota bacterium]
MDIALLLKALILGIVEGLTEFLPVSSTGHLILVGDVLLFNDEKAAVFMIVIQAGAILAVCWEYRAKLIATLAGIAHDNGAQQFALNVFIAFLPLAGLAFMFNKAIKAVLFKPVPVALAFIFGGIIILFAEQWTRKREILGILPRIDSVDMMTWKDALKIGIAQCAALIPGMSRSGSTIIGGMFFGFSRRCVTEFTFFLAIPTLFAATVYSLWKERELLSVTDVPLFSVGSIAAFVSALVVVRWLIRYVSTHDFKVFAWYRIVFGLVVLWTAHNGTVTWSIN